MTVQRTGSSCPDLSPRQWAGDHRRAPVDALEYLRVMFTVAIVLHPGAELLIGLAQELRQPKRV